jgi:hypothetical protein
VVGVASAEIGDEGGAFLSAGTGEGVGDAVHEKANDEARKQNDEARKCPAKKPLQ